MMMTTSGCSANIGSKIQIPGNPNLSDYSTHFDIDWKVFESGTYVYGPEGSAVRNISGRGGYQSFYDLTLDLKFKDGRNYHEKVDVQSLIGEMLKKYDIHDLRADKWGGTTTLNIDIKRNKLIINYMVRERIIKENPKRYLSKKYYYPVFEKPLD